MLRSLLDNNNLYIMTRDTKIRLDREETRQETLTKHADHTI